MLATIAQIETVRPHPNADKLDLVTVGGYQVIVSKESYRVGDLCVFIQPDVLLPDADWAAPYIKRGRRVRAINLRGEWSFGVVESVKKLGLENCLPGTDVSDVLGITKYELLPHNAEIKAPTLPFGIPKTDQMRYQSIDVEEHYGKRVLVTLKIDGQSATYYWHNNVFGVCGRTVEYKLGMVNNYTCHVTRYNLEQRLHNYCVGHGVNLALRGGSYGQKIQSYKYNPHSRLPNNIAFFAVWLIDEGRYTNPWEKHSVWDVCGALNLPTVPILEDTTLTPELINAYERMPHLPNGALFEGVVIVGENFSFKVINLHYDSKK